MADAFCRTAHLLMNSSRTVSMSTASRMDKGKDSKKKGKVESKCSEEYGHHTPEKELAIVVLHAGEMGDVHYLKDYLQMTKLTGELNINEQDSKGCTPLHFAVASKKIDVVTTLVEYGANVNLRDYMGFTPLFWATGRYADAQIANYLIDKGRASVHITTETGACALHGAALQGNLDCITLLLKYGADPQFADHNGNTPLDLAKDDATRMLLQKVLRHNEAFDDKSADRCVQCGVVGASFKRCGRCFVVKYCNQKCQIAHWKNGHRNSCVGFIIASLSSKYGFTLSMPQMKAYVNTPDQEKTRNPLLKKKKFIVKVQVPVDADNPGILELSGGQMLVYNADRSVNGLITSDKKGYKELRDLIAKEGFMGIKAFFWAEMNSDLDDGSFKIFHGQCAPYQSW